MRAGAPDGPARLFPFTERLRPTSLPIDEERCAHCRADREHGGDEQHGLDMFSRLHVVPIFFVSCCGAPK